MARVVQILIPLILFIGGTVGLLVNSREVANQRANPPTYVTVTGYVRSIKTEIRITKSGSTSNQWATVEYGFGGRFYSTKILANRPLREGEPITFEIDKDDPGSVVTVRPQGKRAVMNVVYWCFVGIGGLVLTLMAPDLRRRWVNRKKNRGSQ